MPSPFPGMDPYLEYPAFWSDFHFTFINYWSEAVANALPSQYEASLGERECRVDDDPYLKQLAGPDLVVLDNPRETYIEILHQPDRSLVAALELLSPANKEEPGRTQYLTKRRALIYQHVHLIELDLLRGGHRLPMEKPLPPADCYYFLARAEERPDCQVYHWTLPQPLPALPVPLRAPDADILIDLAAVFTTAYDRGRFARRLRYDGLPPAHLRDEEKEWAQTILETK